jgi:hypothetical protein
MWYYLFEFKDIVTELPIDTTMSYQDEEYKMRDVIVTGHAQDGSGRLSVEVESIDHGYRRVLPLEFSIHIFKEDVPSDTDTDDDWKRTKKFKKNQQHHREKKGKGMKKLSKLTAVLSSDSVDRAEALLERFESFEQGTDDQSTDGDIKIDLSLVGKRVEVVWSKDDKFVHFAGVVTRADKETQTYLVKYDDGDEEWETLQPTNQSHHLIDNAWRFEDLSATYIPQTSTVQPVGQGDAVNLRKRKHLVTMEDFLDTSFLSQYTEIMIHLGYDDLEYLRELPFEDLRKVLIDDIEMKKGHAAKFQAYLHK